MIVLARATSMYVMSINVFKSEISSMTQACLYLNVQTGDLHQLPLEHIDLKYVL